MVQSDSAIARTPTEIWCKILEHVIDVPEYFDATCEGSFSHFRRSSTNSALYFQSMVYLKKLKKVCRSWESFAVERAHRLVDVTATLRHPLEVVRRAHAADIMDYKYDVLECSTLWRKVTIAIRTGDQATTLVRMAENRSRFPHLRRIYIKCALRDTSYLTHLGHFDNITLLSLKLDYSTFHYSYPYKQVTLARVEILIWEAWEDETGPSKFFYLPSLRHLAMTGPFKDPLPLAAPFKETLVSLHIEGSREGRLRVSDLFAFPKLEEFATNRNIDATNVLSYPPLPSLTRMYLDARFEENIIEIRNMLAGGLRRSSTLRAGFHWGLDGRIPLWRSGATQEVVDEVLRSCEEQGIKFVDADGMTRPIDGPVMITAWLG